MIQLHTFGEALIQVGEKHVRPSAPVLFAALLYLCVERGRRVPRAALQEMLFPETDERSGAHSLRQLLYKLRQLGVPLDADGSGVALPANAVQQHAMNGSGAAVLPGFDPDISEEFTRWLDAYRARSSASAREDLLKTLARARSTGESARALELAETLLEIDPLNESATFAKAESLALAGQKVEAVRLLDAYADEVGATSPELRLPADLLRRRISERAAFSERPAIPMFGRQAELAELLGHFDRAASGTPTMSVIWGDPGIGKTRLVQEFRAHMALRTAVVEVAHCRPHDTGRPMGAMIDLVPRLLQARGALAVSPEAMTDLRRLVGSSPDPAIVPEPPEIVAARIRRALEDLILAVSAEAPVVLIVEDAHWLDEASLAFLHWLLERECRLHMVVTRRTQPQIRPGIRLSQNWYTRQLEPLTPTESRELLTRVYAYDGRLQAELTDHCTALAAGNALFIYTIAEHLRQSGAAPPSKATLHDLLTQRLKILSPSALLLLRFIAAFGAHGNQERLQRSIALTSSSLLLALQEIAECGLIAQQGAHIRTAHDLLSEVAISTMPDAVRVAVMERVAQTLEADGMNARAATLLWACSDCWQQAENRARAVRALRQCARYAVDIGQLQYALEALEKAQLTATDDDLAEVLTDLIRVADDLCRHEVVLRAAEQLRHLRSGYETASRSWSLAEFAVINAERRRMFSVWSKRAALERCALDPANMPWDRIRAARVYLLEAEEALDQPSAETLFSAVRDDLKGIVTNWELNYLDLTYHGSFGDLDVGADLAMEFLRERTRAPSRVGLVTFSNAAYVLYRAGRVRLALDSYRSLVEESQRLGIGSFTTGNYAGQTVMMAITVGDMELANEYLDLSARLFSKTGDSLQPVYLANAIDLAIANRDTHAARRYYDILTERYPHCFTANRDGISLGHRLMIGWLDGEEPGRPLLDRGFALYEVGKAISDADSLAVGLALALQRTKSAEAASAFFSDYVARWRRDRFPLNATYATFLREASVMAV